MKMAVFWDVAPVWYMDLVTNVPEKLTAFIIGR
jgi:hypothetical protein